MQERDSEQVPVGRRTETHTLRHCLCETVWHRSQTGTRWHCEVFCFGLLLRECHQHCVRCYAVRSEVKQQKAQVVDLYCAFLLSECSDLIINNSHHSHGADAKLHV